MLAEARADNIDNVFHKFKAVGPRRPQRLAAAIG